MKKNKSKIKLFRNINKPLFFLTLIYAIVGAFLILDASSISSRLIKAILRLIIRAKTLNFYRVFYVFSFRFNY
jgi:hypothetical protein